MMYLPVTEKQQVILIEVLEMHLEGTMRFGAASNDKEVTDKLADDAIETARLLKLLK